MNVRRLPKVGQKASDCIKGNRSQGSCRAPPCVLTGWSPNGAVTRGKQRLGFRIWFCPNSSVALGKTHLPSLCFLVWEMWAWSGNLPKPPLHPLHCDALQVLITEQRSSLGLDWISVVLWVENNWAVCIQLP